MTSALPSLTPRKVIAALKRGGFSIEAVKGSHYHLTHPDRAELIVTVAYHNKDLKPGTLRAIIRQAGMTPEEFLELL